MQYDDRVNWCSLMLCSGVWGLIYQLTIEYFI